MNELEQFGRVSAIWIMACNDENSLITYEGLRHRLNIESTESLRELVLAHSELFRLGANSRQLREWKERMLLGRGRPSWVKSIPEESERLTRIEALSQNDMFRSRFRTRANSPKSDVEILKWGLEYLERQRKARAEAVDASVKSWQIWLVLAVGILGLVVQLAIAFS
ncbi:MAG: hypothetical protein IPI81_11890 [Flavobacteriales bacterium]|nr:hypothetical protein [Flavobacteriales bacterium]MCC6939104.1 hypothetical protein [Flavobacteriales bacterium]